MLSIWQLIAIAVGIFCVGVFLFSLTLGSIGKQGEQEQHELWLDAKKAGALKAPVRRRVVDKP